MENMGLRNIYGETLSDTWKVGAWSYLGMTCNGYLNMFFLYGAQGPTAFSNGPSCVKVQGGRIVEDQRRRCQGHQSYVGCRVGLAEGREGAK
jgi:hypothetical protein